MVDIVVIINIRIAYINIIAAATVVIISITIIITVTIVRPVVRWAPPTSAAVSPIIITDTNIEPANVYINAKTPARPGRISHIISPGAGSGIIIPSMPWPVIIPGSIYNGWTADIVI